MEIFTVARHLTVGYNHVQLAMSEMEKDSSIFSEIRSKGLFTFEENGYHYIAEMTKFDESIYCQHTWATIYAKLWPVLFANGFKLEKEEPNCWTFVRAARK